MIETLWSVCAWTGLIWWSGVVIAATVIPCAAVVKALCDRWEEAELRRIAAANEDDLPPNWGELDSYRSTEEAWAEKRRRKSGGA